MLVIGAVTAIFAISGTADPTWVSGKYTDTVAKDTSGGTEDVTVRGNYGLTAAVSSSPEFILSLEEKFTRKMSVSPNSAIVSSSSFNTGGANDGPALVRFPRACANACYICDGEKLLATYASRAAGHGHRLVVVNLHMYMNRTSNFLNRMMASGISISFCRLMVPRSSMSCSA